MIEANLYKKCKVCEKVKNFEETKAVRIFYRLPSKDHGISFDVCNTCLKKVFNLEIKDE